MPTLPRVVIPVRSLDAGKSRLSHVLDVARRQELIEAMLGDVLDAVDTAGFTDVVIASCGAHAAALASRFGVPSVPDSKEGGGLNAALTAILHDSQPHVDAVMIVAADLPQVQPSDLLAVAFESAAVVIAPTHDGGTAVMKLAPPTAIPLAYGHQSAAQHAAAAETFGCTLTVLHRPGFTADLDTPADLAHALQMLTATHPTPHFGARTRQVLMSQHTANAATLRPFP